jgi:hypothetical protein
MTPEHADTFLRREQPGTIIPLAPNEELPRKALHFSQGKVGLDQLPVEILMEWATVFDYGAEKYARNNWRSGTEWHEFYGSAFRHLIKWWLGEDIDPETGLNHMAHALWNIATLRYYQIHGLGHDDRPPALPADYARPQYNKPEPRRS